MQARQPQSIAASIAGLTTFSQAEIQKKIDKSAEYASILRNMHDSLLFTDDKTANTNLCRELFEKTQNCLLLGNQRTTDVLPKTHTMQTLAEVYRLLSGAEKVICVLTPEIHHQLLKRVSESWFALGIYQDLFTKMINLNLLTVENVLLSVQLELDFILAAFTQFQARVKNFNTNLALPQLLEHADPELMQTLDNLFKPIGLLDDKVEVIPAPLRKLQRHHVIMCLLAFFELYESLKATEKFPRRAERVNHIKKLIQDIMATKLENDEDNKQYSNRVASNFNLQFKKVMAEYNAVLSQDYLVEHTFIQADEMLSAIREHMEVETVLQLIIKNKVFTVDKQKNTELCRLLFTMNEPSFDYAVCINLFEELKQQECLTYDTALLTLQPALYRIHANMKTVPESDRALHQLLELANSTIINKLAAFSISVAQDNEFSSGEPDNGAHVYWCLLQYFCIYEDLKNQGRCPDRDTRSAEILSMIKTLSDSDEYPAQHARFYSVMHLSAQQLVDRLREKYRLKTHEPQATKQESCLIC